MAGNIKYLQPKVTEDEWVNAWVSVSKTFGGWIGG